MVYGIVIKLIWYFVGLCSGIILTALIVGAKND